MALPLKLYHVTPSNRLVSGPSSTPLFNLPDFVSGGIIAIEYQALSGNGMPYEIVPIAQYAAPQIGIFSAGGTQLAYQNSFVADGLTNVYTGVLSLQDAAFTSAVSAATPTAPVEAYFVIQVTDSAGQPVQLPPQSVNLYKALITTAATAVTPPDVAATQAWVLTTAVKREADDGAPRIVKSLDGSKSFLKWYDNDGVEQTQNL